MVCTYYVGFASLLSSFNVKDDHTHTHTHTLIVGKYIEKPYVHYKHTHNAKTHGHTQYIPAEKAVR